MTMKWFSGILTALLLCACHPNEERGAWKIVKQRGHENYGYVTESGGNIIIAGFTNKASAVAAMEERKWNVRNPPKPKKPESMWGDVP